VVEVAEWWKWPRLTRARTPRRREKEIILKKDVASMATDSTPQVISLGP
jgi:hypothetical protein